ncbi:PepSY domain-containing protein [Ornithinimicrobium sp. Y1847]|uniref:PepSY domain-containing protein n=1 Tax=Ornithinimicrobium sp. Y1847 TaxID=3405419 RepID=UPI003B6751F3
MRTNTNRTMTAALALVLSLTLTACGSNDTEGDGVTPPPTGSAQENVGDTTDDGPLEDVGDPTAPIDDDADMTEDEDVSEGEAMDLTQTALAAIATAEEETGGIAYEIDDQDDDGTWEVDVRVDDRSVEVTVSEDGTEVVGTEDDDLDDDDRAALDAAEITIQEAIQIAIDEVGGVLDDVELEEDDGRYYWEVSVDSTDRGMDDVEVKIDVTTGEIIEIDD